MLKLFSQRYKIFLKMNIKYNNAIRMEGVDCFIVSCFQKLKGAHDYDPSNIFARARLV